MKKYKHRPGFSECSNRGVDIYWHGTLWASLDAKFFLLGARPFREALWSNLVHVLFLDVMLYQKWNKWNMRVWVLILFKYK